MKSRMFKSLALAMVTVLFSTGCMMSRLVDRAFLGITVRRPAYNDRKTTGVFLLPFTFAVDVATFPIQALLIVILGDKFPFTDPPDALHGMQAVLDQSGFEQLSDQAKQLATAELEQLLREGKLSPTSALALGDDGHWTVVELSAEAHSQLLARAQQPAPSAQLVCQLDHQR